MSTAQIVQLLITLAGIALAMIAFLFGPFEIFGNAVLAFVIRSWTIWAVDMEFP